MASKIAHRDPTREVINSVYFHGSEAVATDTIRLAVQPLNQRCDRSMIVPSSALRALGRIQGMLRSSLKLSVPPVHPASGKGVSSGGILGVDLVGAHIRAFVQLIPGKYPDYNRALRHEGHTVAWLTVSRADALEALLSLKYMAARANRPTLLSIADGHLVFRIEAGGWGRMESQCPVWHTAKWDRIGVIGFRWQYLVDALNWCKEPEVTIEFRGQEAAADFISGNQRLALMPMELEGECHRRRHEEPEEESTPESVGAGV